MGYANRTWENNGDFVMVCSQFQTIGKDADKMTLGCLVPAGNWKPEKDYIKVFKSDSDVDFEAVYLDEATAALYRSLSMDWVVAGWYSKKDKSYTTPLDDTEFPLGCTVMAMAANTGAALQTSGEVVESESGVIEITWENNGDFLMFGNCTPVPITLENLVPAGKWKPEKDYIKIFKSDSDVDFEAVYLDEATAALYRSLSMDWVVAGWYSKKDKSYTTPLKTPLAPGCGIMAMAANAGAKLTIPSAL